MNLSDREMERTCQFDLDVKFALGLRIDESVGRMNLMLNGLAIVVYRYLGSKNCDLSYCD